MEERLYPQRWLILAVLFVVVSILQFAVIITPGIATIFIPEYGFTPAQFVSSQYALFGQCCSVFPVALWVTYGTRKSDARRSVRICCRSIMACFR